MLINSIEPLINPAKTEIVAIQLRLKFGEEPLNLDNLSIECLKAFWVL
ncbi:MAG: hypothetical protein ACFFDK_14715 [Promethearchaeota archaeon]